MRQTCPLQEWSSKDIPDYAVARLSFDSSKFQVEWGSSLTPLARRILWRSSLSSAGSYKPTTP